MNNLEKGLLAEGEKRVLSVLSIGPKTWQELKKETAFSDRTLAKHIKRLLDKGLITEEIDRKDRRRKIYRINEEGLKQLYDDLLAIDLALTLFLKEEDILKECKKIENIDERRKYLINKIKENVGDLFILGLFRGERGVNIVLRALELYSCLTEGGKWVQLDTNIKEEFNRIFCVHDVKLLFKDIVNIITKLCEIVKIGELIQNDEELLKMYYEKEKEIFSQQTLDYSKWEVKEETMRIKRFVERIREKDVVLGSLINSICARVKVSKEDIKDLFKNS